MTEQGILDYEEDLESLYVALSSDLEKELSYIYNTFSTDGKITYDKVRYKLDNKKLNQFKRILKTIYAKYDLNIITKDLLNTTKKLFDRKNISVLEYIQFMCLYHITELAVQNSEYVYNILYDTYLANYCVDFYYFMNGVQKEIEYIPVSSQDIVVAVKNKWNGATYMERIENSCKQLYQELSTNIPRFIAMSLPLTEAMNRIDKILNVRQNYDKTIIRTSGDYINNEAHKKMMENLNVDSYRYVAVLDNRTTEGCRNLNGSVFKLSEAKLGINFPPLHFNCRSSVSPNLSESYLRGIQQNKGISRKNFIQDWLKSVLPDNEHYIIPYITRYL